MEDGAMTDMASIANESFNRAMQSFRDVAQTTARLQEESVKGLQQMLADMALPVWQRRAQGVVNNILAVAEKNTEETLQTVEQNLKTSMGVWQKACAAQPDNSQPNQPDQQGRATEFWQAMAGILRTNAEAMIRANRRIIGAWAEVGKMATNGQSDEAAQASKAVAKTP
jgi:hypothetical protein